jgi:hypothetical protein
LKVHFPRHIITDFRKNQGGFEKKSEKCKEKEAVTQKAPCPSPFFDRFSAQRGRTTAAKGRRAGALSLTAGRGRAYLL